MHIRPEQPKDEAAIRDVLKQAFAPSEGEARLVDQLRQQDDFLISLVAEVDETIVGHVLFTHATIMPQTPIRLAALAPVAVLPSHQNEGIGTALIYFGLDECQKLEFDAVAVLGHADYYPRFGFEVSTTFGLKCEWDVPEPVFMIKELKQGVLKQQEGIVKYLPVFSEI